MKVKLSLTKQYLLFLTIVIIVLITTTLAITNHVVKNGMSDLFQQRLLRAGEVLNEHSRSRYLNNKHKYEAVLKSPRFIAAVATEDNETIKSEAPAYKQMLDCQLFIIADNKGEFIYNSLPNDSLNRQLKVYLSGNTDETSIKYIYRNDLTYEIYINMIVSSDGYQLGWLIAGREFSNKFAEELKRLTGLDVIISYKKRIIGTSNSILSKKVLENQDRFLSMIEGTQFNSESNWEDESLAYLSVTEIFSASTITFIADIDKQISPILSRVGLLLIFLSIAGGLIAILAIYIFTDRRIGRQVSQLVLAAEKIADGNFDFEIIKSSEDELGYLAGEFEKMRSELLSSKVESERIQNEKLKSSRMAAVGQMATGIFHDFKSPMAVIKGNAELLNRKLKNDEALNRYCDSIQSQVDRMVEMAQDVIEFTSGQTRINLQPLCFSEYIDEIMVFQFQSFEEAGIALNKIDGVPIELSIDKNKFRRVFDNILNNAREALSPTRRVEISWKLVNKKLIVTIEDNGPGIPEEIVETLFEPFVTSGKVDGSGLGLAISKKIIDDHGASIEVISKINHGTKFEITFPSQLLLPNNKKNEDVSSLIITSETVEN